MIDEAVVLPPEGYHAFVERATRWFRNRHGPAQGAEGSGGERPSEWRDGKGLLERAVGLTAAMVTGDGQNWGPE